MFFLLVSRLNVLQSKIIIYKSNLLHGMYATHVTPKVILTEQQTKHLWLNELKKKSKSKSLSNSRPLNL